MATASAHHAPARIRDIYPDLIWLLVRAAPACQAVAARVVLAATLAVAAAGSAHASNIQNQSPDVIFAAACSTCHAADGTGGFSWINNRYAPPIAGLPSTTDAEAKAKVRQGADNRGMPAFGPEDVTDTELDELVAWLRGKCTPPGCPAPAKPPGRELEVDLLDGDPFYSDRGADNAADPFDDPRRVVLSSGDHLKLVNGGRTWHTMTNPDVGIDSGYLGYSGNLGPQTGYYYADQATGLAPGCQRYQCRLHPYMQVEVCTAGHVPVATTTASKVPLSRPAVPGATGSEVWVLAQFQNDAVADPYDGAVQVVDATTWSVKNHIPDVGNNPHNGWPGTSAGGAVALSASWHDNTVTLLDTATKTKLATKPVGASPAHVQVTPGAAERWFVTVMGSRAVQEIDVDLLRAGLDPNVGAPIRGDTTPHGIWFCDDGEHYLTANTFANTASLYSVSQAAQLSSAPSGGSSPLAVGILGGVGPAGCARAYTNNAGSASVSVYDVDVAAGTITHNTSAVPPALRDAAGNLKLADLTATPVRWAHLPIQTPVSPAGATTHGRFLVTPNKASFNVSVTALDASGNPTQIFTFPAGLGAHGVAFGRKGLCDSGNPSDVCYYAYVTFTFQDYIGVYDLERVIGAPAPGSAAEAVRLEGHAATLLCAQPSCALPITTFCPDCRSGAHVGDVPLALSLTRRRPTTYLKEMVWVAPLGGAVELDLAVRSSTGAQGVFVVPSAPPWP